MDVNIALLAGDGIGPEVMAEALKVMDAAAKKFGFTVTRDERLVGGAAIDAVGVPLPDATVEACKAADAVFLGAVGGPKWDTIDPAIRPERGLLGIRKAACSPTCVPRPCSPNLPARACCVPTFPPRALISSSCAN